MDKKEIEKGNFASKSKITSIDMDIVKAMD